MYELRLASNPANSSKNFFRCLPKKGNPCAYAPSFDLPATKVAQLKELHSSPLLRGGGDAVGCVGPHNKWVPKRRSC